MSYPVQTYEQIRDAILRDLVNQNPQAVVGADSDFRLRANATAAAIEGLYQYQAWTVRQIFPDTADEDVLLQYASLYGMGKKAATAATGNITFMGTVGAGINAGVTAKTLDGNTYVTTGNGSVGADGTVTIAAKASVAGFAGNQPVGTSLTLTASPAGVSSTAMIANMTTGTDIESSDALLARLLDRLRHPPAGGNKYDYLRWTLEVPGVTSAWCFPLRRGLGTVDVAILSNGAPTTLALQNAVKAYIDTVNPAGGDFQVLTPTLVPVNVAATVAVSGVLLSDVQAVVQSLIAAYIAGLKPGDSVLRSRILASITDISGVTDVTLTSPAASIVCLVDADHIEMASLGTVILT